MRQIAPPPVQIAILAAGRGERMRGEDKLLRPVGGQPLLRKLSLEALAIGLPLALVLPPPPLFPARRAAVADLPLTCLEGGASSDEGLSASLRAALAHSPPDAALMVLLADMPGIDARDLASLCAAQRRHPRSIIRACDASSAPGHPVIFPPESRPGLRDLLGDRGARDFLRARAGETHFVELPGDHATLDLDTPEQWRAWERSLR